MCSSPLANCDLYTIFIPNCNSSCTISSLSGNVFVPHSYTSKAITRAAEPNATLSLVPLRCPAAAVTTGRLGISEASVPDGGATGGEVAFWRGGAIG